MNIKKTLAILEILCPLFNKSEASDGTINYNTPTGHLLFLPYQCKLVYKAIWNPDNEVLTATEKIFRLAINLVFSIALTPVMLIVWTVGQLIFAMHYDHKQREAGNKSNLMLAYSTVTILVLGLIACVVDYSINKQDRFIDLTPKTTVTDMEEEPKVERIITRISADEPCNNVPEVTTVTTTEPIITTTAETIISINEDDGYVLKRKTR